MDTGFSVNMLNTGGFFRKESSERLAKEYLKLLLLTQKGSFLGDPYFGTNLMGLIGNPNDFVTENLIIDDIYESVCVYIPEITLQRKDIVVERKRGKVDIHIKYTYNKNNKSDILDIPLLQVQGV